METLAVFAPPDNIKFRGVVNVADMSGLGPEGTDPASFRDLRDFILETDRQLTQERVKLARLTGGKHPLIIPG